MWGALKRKGGPTDAAVRAFLSSSWEDSRGIEEVRKFVTNDPVPWRAFHLVHSSKHLLQDRNCAALLQWSTQMMSMEPDTRRRRYIHKMSTEMFRAMTSSHKPGPRARAAFYALCNEAGDLSLAYQWFNHHASGGESLGSNLIKSGGVGSDPTKPTGVQEMELADCAWLLKIANNHISMDAAEEMAFAVHEAVLDAFGGDAEVAFNVQPTDPENVLQGKIALIDEFRRILPKVADVDLRDAINQMSYAQEDRDHIGKPLYQLEGLLQAHQQGGDITSVGSSGTSSDHTPATVSFDTPRLQGSLLNPEFLQQLEEASFREGSVAKVAQLVEFYQQQLADELDQFSKQRLKTKSAIFNTVGKDAKRFRKQFLQTGNKAVTAELYHYLIVAICKGGSPGLALKTLDSMERASMQPLDATLAVVVASIVASEDDTAAAASVIKMFYDEFNFREKEDQNGEEYRRSFAAFWTYDYPLFLLHRNRLMPTEFITFIAQHVGIGKLPELQAAYHQSGVLGGSPDSFSAQDLVVLDDDYCKAVSTVLMEGCRNANDVNAAVEFITTCAPALDVALMGKIPQLEDYVLPSSRDDIYTSLDAIQKGLFGGSNGQEAVVANYSYQNIFLLDASFIEEAPQFATLHAKHPNSLLLIPYVALKQIAEAMEPPKSLDVDVIRAHKMQSEESNLRLMQVSRLVESGVAEVLHFTECIQSHFIQPPAPSDVVGGSQKVTPLDTDDKHLAPVDFKTTQENIHFGRVAMMLNGLARGCGSATTIHVCCNDPQVRELVNDMAKTAPEAAVDGLRWVTSYKEAQEVEDPLQESGEKEPHGVPEATNTASSVNVLDSLSALGLAGQGADWQPVLEQPPAGGSSTLPQEDNNGVEQGLDSNTTAEATVSAADEMEDEEEDSAAPWMSLLDDDDEVFPTPSSEGGPEQVETVAHHENGTTCTPAVSDQDHNVVQQETTTASDVDIDNVYRGNSIQSLQDELEAANKTAHFFDEFETMDPERLQELQSMNRRVFDNDGKVAGRNKPRVLGRDYQSSRVTSWNKKRKEARHLSNHLGAKVPGHMSYNRFEANVNDPRNKHLLKAYKDGVSAKRRDFKHHKSVERAQNRNGPPLPEGW